jgi:hypothetical protein
MRGFVRALASEATNRIWLLYIYMVIAVLTGISALVKGAIYAGIAGIVGPTLCWWAASGLKGSLMVGTRSQKIGGLVAAIVFAVMGFGLVYHSGYWVTLFGYEFTGVTWCAIGSVIGFIATKREHAI